MKISNLRIKNYRSIVDSGDIRIESFQSLVGENNVGKSNILYALQSFLTSGAGGIKESDFFNSELPVIITSTFSNLTEAERKKLKIYLLGDKLILEKHIELQVDNKSGKNKTNAIYHGYKANPKDWWLSIEGVSDHEGTNRPNWENVATDNNIIDYVRDNNGRVNKASYEIGLQKIIIEDDSIEFEEPELGKTQALGLQPNLLDNLPSFHLLPAITDYSDEISRQSTSTNFRRLMGDLADRVLKLDPKFIEIETSINKLTSLLNTTDNAEDITENQERLGVLDDVEEKLKNIISQMMPTVSGVRIKVNIDGIKNIFSQGVSILINDGTFTEVITKGHGLQRCVVFSLLQALILNLRGKLISVEGQESDETESKDKTIILAIEEPELYIHPQIQRLIYSVLKDFGQTDQVIYTTHSLSFIDLGQYESIAVIRKDTVDEGTKSYHCVPGILDAGTERKTFQFFRSFGLENNRLFFSKKVILVEGPEDLIGIIATGRKLKLFKELPEERGYTIIVTDGKQEMIKHLKLLNAFKIPYNILHELDGSPNSDNNKNISRLIGNNKSIQITNNLEDAVGHNGHFSNKYASMKFFENPQNINNDFEEIVKALFDIS